jgi:uncharacterized membrane-anchored protein YitT (DUF2179 family)
MQTKVTFKNFLSMHIGIVFIALSTYFILVPNHFVTGGMTGLSTILAQELTFLTQSQWLLLLNALVLILGFIFLGKSTGVFTVYCSMGYSSLMMIFEANNLVDKISPEIHTLTEEPFMELVVGITLYAIGTAIIFYAGASSGGMDIVALIIQKYTKMDVGRAVLAVNSIIAITSIFVFKDITTGILSLVGLFMNSFIIDTVIDNFNACKYFIVITDKPELVAEYIMNTLHHGVTITDAIGAYTQAKKGMVHTVCRRYEAIKLRQAIKQIDENAFMVVTTSSEIIGKGFRSV